MPTPRLAFWLAASFVGALVEPLVPGMVWATAAADAVLAGMVWHDYQTLASARGLRMERRAEPIFSLGVENPVALEAVNPSAVPLTLEIVDEPPAEFRTEGDSQQVRVAPGTRWKFSYHTTPPRRGDFAFGALNFRARTDLGLVAVQRQETPADARVRVYPNLRDSRHLALLAMRDQLAQMGIRTARTPEAGREFESLRDYVSGDEYRTVDWKATARRSRLTTRQYDVERSQKLLIVLDLGRTMTSRLGDLTKADLAINATVLLTSVAARLDDRVGVVAFADKILGVLPPGRGRMQSMRLLEFLYPLEAVPREADYLGAFTEIARRVQGRTLVIVFTDLVDPESSSQLIAQLGVLARRHAVLCVALADYELDRILAGPPEDIPALYRQTVAQTLLDDRDQAAAKLSARGVGVMKASPEHLSVQVVNRYLGFKATGRVR